MSNTGRPVRMLFAQNASLIFGKGPGRFPILIHGFA